MTEVYRPRTFTALAVLAVLAATAQDHPKIFRITPARPVAELRVEALAALPPHEPGEFRPSRLTGLMKLDGRLKFEIRYATTGNFLSTPVYTSALALLQRPAALALLHAHRDLLRAAMKK